MPARRPVQSVVDRLVAAGCVAAEDEADELMTAAPDEETLDAWLDRRERGEPLPWITGTINFCGHRLAVAPGVYVPRVQSEELARRSAELLVERGCAVDLCTGAGAVAAHLMWARPGAAVIGVDIDRRAVACARGNGVRAILADLDSPLRSRAFDVITAIPPYVPTADLRLLPSDVQRYEPPLALHGGGDGLDVARRIVAAAARLLRPGGWLLIEVGGRQDDMLGPTLTAYGFEYPASWFDDDGDLRGLVARRGR